MLQLHCRNISENGVMRPEDVHVPVEALSETFLAATGPGGQNVNKVATAVQLRVDLFRLGLHPEAYERLKQIAGSRVTGAGELLITARRFRTQESNRADARRRLAEMIAAAHMVQRKRKPTRPSKAAKAQRVEKKRQRSAVKQTRGKVTFD
jgi:ribosome-associated protein